MGRPRNTEQREERQNKLMCAYERIGLLMPAAREVGIPVFAHYKWLKDDPEYTARFTEVQARVKASGLDKSAYAATLTNRSHGPITRGERYERVKTKKAEFLKALAILGVPTDAARYVGVQSVAPAQWAKRDPEFAARLADVKAATVQLRLESLSERRSRASKTSWANTEKREEWAKNQHESWTPERRAEQSERMRERLQDPIAREKIGRAAKVNWTPEAKEALSKAMKKRWADPEYREARLAEVRSPARREKASQASKAQWEAKTPEERKEQMSNARRAFKGGHGITRIEAKVIAYLGECDIPIIPHKALGDYVADIYVPNFKLDIECDGSAFHDDSTAQRESERDAELVAHGITVLRLSESDIKAGDFTRLREALGIE